MSISISTEFRSYLSVPEHQPDAATNQAARLTTIDAIGSAHFLETNPQTMVTDATGAASDVCTGVCMTVGAVAGTGIGAAIANVPGAKAGFEIGFAVGTIGSQFFCGGTPSCNERRK